MPGSLTPGRRSSRRRRALGRTGRRPGGAPSAARLCHRGTVSVTVRVPHAQPWTRTMTLFPAAATVTITDRGNRGPGGALLVAGPSRTAAAAADFERSRRRRGIGTQRPERPRAASRSRGRGAGRRRGRLQAKKWHGILGFFIQVTKYKRAAIVVRLQQPIIVYPVFNKIL